MPDNYLVELKQQIFLLVEGDSKRRIAWLDDTREWIKKNITEATWKEGDRGL